MNDHEMLAMIHKAENIRDGIKNDSFALLDNAMDIDCMFCRDYKLSITQYKVGESQCKNCPMYIDKMCDYDTRPNEAHTPFRTVDRYRAYYESHSRSWMQKNKATLAAEQLVEWVTAFATKQGE